MRRISFAATVFLIAALSAPCVSFAAGNVLLPSDSGDNSSLPNLGLGGGSSSSAPSLSALPLTQPPPAATPNATTAPAPTATTTPAKGLSAAPAPSQSTAKPPAPATLQSILSPIDKASAARLPPGALPTRVFHQPDNSAILAQATQNLPYGLTIAIDGKSYFGAKDVQTLNNKLGLSRAQIPTNCVMTVRGLVQTDKGMYMLVGDASPQVTFRYDGAIKKYLMAANALCTADALPPGSGFLFETGGRYSIPLQPIDCPVPNRQVTRLNITYTGGGAAQCAYQ